MSGVDVLAVLDSHTSGAWHHELETRGYQSPGLGKITTDGEQALAAVAELIEAASDHVNGGAIGVFARKERLLAALSRVRGAA